MLPVYMAIISYAMVLAADLSELAEVRLMEMPWASSAARGSSSHRAARRAMMKGSWRW